MEREDGWEGDPIVVLLISGKGNERKVWIKTDRGGKYVVPLATLKVTPASGEFSLPLFDPTRNLIFIGSETEVSALGRKDQCLVDKVTQIALARKCLAGN